jgi:hypothetical protein
MHISALPPQDGHTVALRPMAIAFRCLICACLAAKSGLSEFVMVCHLLGTFDKVLSLSSEVCHVKRLTKLGCKALIPGYQFVKPSCLKTHFAD